MQDARVRYPIFVFDIGRELSSIQGWNLEGDLRVYSCEAESKGEEWLNFESGGLYAFDADGQLLEPQPSDASILLRNSNSRVWRANSTVDFVATGVFEKQVLKQALMTRLVRATKPSSLEEVQRWLDVVG